MNDTLRDPVTGDLSTPRRTLRDRLIDLAWRIRILYDVHVRWAF